MSFDFNILKSLVKKQVEAPKEIGTKKIFSDETFEMPVSFFHLKLENEPKVKRIGKNTDGIEVCFTTFRTVLFDKLSESEALERLYDLKASDLDKNYEMS